MIMRETHKARGPVRSYHLKIFPRNSIAWTSRPLSALPAQLEKTRKEAGI